MSLITFSDETKRSYYASLVNSIKKCEACQFCDREGNRDIGEGAVPAHIMVVAEAFGIDERREGRPLIGKAGRLWREVMEKNNLLTSSMHQYSTYLTNSQCCRPEAPEDSDAENGKPNEQSIMACKPFLWSKMKLVMPRVLITLGDIATRTILSVSFDDTKWRITEAIKQDHERNWPVLGTVKIVPMYHPSYVLRQGRPANLMSLYDLLLNKVKGFINV